MLPSGGCGKQYFESVKESFHTVASWALPSHPTLINVKILSNEQQAITFQLFFPW